MQYCHFNSYGLFYMWNGSENYKRVGVLNSEQASKWKPRVLRDADGSITWSLTWSGDILLLKSTCWILLNALLPCIPWAFSSNLLSLDRFSLSWDQERRIIASIRDLKGLLEFGLHNLEQTGNYCFRICQNLETIYKQWINLQRTSAFQSGHVANHSWSPHKSQIVVLSIVTPKK